MQIKEDEFKTLKTFKTFKKYDELINKIKQTKYKCNEINRLKSSF